MSDNFTEYMCSIKTVRVWYKPWTWRRRQVLDMWTLGEGISDIAFATNPAIDGQYEGLEADADEPITWDDESEQEQL